MGKKVRDLWDGVAEYEVDEDDEKRWAEERRRRDENTPSIKEAISFLFDLYYGPDSPFNFSDSRKERINSKY